MSQCQQRHSLLSQDYTDEDHLCTGHLQFRLQTKAALQRQNFFSLKELQLLGHVLGWLDSPHGLAPKKLQRQLHSKACARNAARMVYLVQTARRLLLLSCLAI